MIEYKEYKKWELNEDSNEMLMIAIGYFPEKKEYFLSKGGYDWNYKIIDKNKTINLISMNVLNFTGNKFISRLKSNKFSWFPSFVRKEDENADIKKYFDTVSWKRKKYYGDLEINDIEKFLEIFIDVPYRFDYQDILLFSVDKNYLIIISHHGYTCIVTENKNKKELAIIANKIESNNGIVFPRSILGLPVVNGKERLIGS